VRTALAIPTAPCGKERGAGAVLRLRRRS